MSLGKYTSLGSAWTTFYYRKNVDLTMNDADNLIEIKLICGLKKCSLKAFDAIYDMYAKRLYAYCLQYTKSEEDAEEIVQDVFVRLWMNRENIRQEETLRSLLFIMSKHQLINAYRARINSPMYEDYVKYQDHISTEEQGQSLEYEEYVNQLKVALHKLTITQRQVIEMSKLKQLTNKEIAIELELSEQTVKNQLSLGLKKLREELGKMPILFWLLFSVNKLL